MREEKEIEGSEDGELSSKDWDDDWVEDTACISKTTLLAGKLCRELKGRVFVTFFNGTQR